MSGSLNSVFGNVTYALQLHSRTMLNLQEQAATGSCINRPSDNPSGAYRIMGLSSQRRYLENFVNNIENATNAQEMALSVLGKMTDVLTDTRSNLTQIISGTYGEGENGQSARSTAAMQINDVLEQMISFANTKHVRQYIFGGDNTESPPYAVERHNGEIISVTYQGGNEGRNINVAPGVQSDITYAGDDIFRLDARETPVFSGSTGAAVGTGTASVKGDLWLTVTHDGANYKLSIDDGTTEVTVPAAGDVSNIAVTNAGGEILYVDATNITATGTERVRVPGTHDLFNVLISTRDLLRNPAALSGETVADLIDQCSQALMEIDKAIVAKESSLGTKINFLESLKDGIENVKFNGEDEAMALQEADVAQIAIDISRRQALYEMSLSVAGKLMSISLLDFIR